MHAYITKPKLLFVDFVFMSPSPTTTGRIPSKGFTAGVLEKELKDLTETTGILQEHLDSVAIDVVLDRSVNPPRSLLKHICDTSTVH